MVWTAEELVALVLEECELRGMGHANRRRRTPRPAEGTRDSRVWYHYRHTAAPDRAEGAGKNTMKRIALPCALLLLAPLLATAQEPAPDTAQDDAANRVRQCIEFLAALPAYSADIAMGFSARTTDGDTSESSLTAHLSMAGNDRARFRVNVEEGTMELFFMPDAKYIYLDATKQYVDGSAFGERNQALTLMPGREYRAAQVLLSDLLHGDTTLLENAREIRFVTGEDAGEDAPDQVQIAAEGLVVDFWIQKGDAPLLDRFSMDITGMLAQANSEVAAAVVNYSLTKWNLSPKFAADHFNFTMPEGATELQRAQQQPQAGSLEGKPAPAITLDLLESGGKLDLAEHKGKNVVILDFWASWCGPCRIGLPIVSEVTAQFAEKGVVFYAVNVGEDARTAQSFVEQTGLTAPVVMDPRGVAQRDYRADSIPMTVIIARDGTVHEVHRGVSPNLKAELTRTLTKLTE